MTFIPGCLSLQALTSFRRRLIAVRVVIGSYCSTKSEHKRSCALSASRVYGNRQYSLQRVHHLRVAAGVVSEIHGRRGLVSRVAELSMLGYALQVHMHSVTYILLDTGVMEQCVLDVPAYS